MMKSATKDKVYKSPVRKLARFFEKSRDRWKSRVQELEAQVKQIDAKEQESKEQLETLEPVGAKKTIR